MNWISQTLYMSLWLAVIVPLIAWVFEFTIGFRHTRFHAIKSPHEWYVRLYHDWRSYPKSIELRTRTPILRRVLLWAEAVFLLGNLAAFAASSQPSPVTVIALLSFVSVSSIWVIIVGFSNRNALTEWTAWDLFFLRQGALVVLSLSFFIVNFQQQSPFFLAVLYFIACFAISIFAQSWFGDLKPQSCVQGMTSGLVGIERVAYYIAESAEQLSLLIVPILIIGPLLPSDHPLAVLSAGLVLTAFLIGITTRLFFHFSSLQQSRALLLILVPILWLIAAG